MNGDENVTTAPTGTDIGGGVSLGDLPDLRPAGNDQPLQRDAERGQKQPRKNGQFAPRETVKEVERGMRREDVRAAVRSALGRETDADALDGVQPGRKDPAAKTDQRQPAKGTLDTAKDGPADTTRAAELEKARAALKLDRWTDARLAKLTDEQILDFGKEAQDEHAAKYREGREQAAAAKANKAGAAGESPTDDTDLEALAKEHFKPFEGDENGEVFHRAITGFAKATHAKVRAELAADLEAFRAEAIKGIDKMRSDLRNVLTYEVGLGDLKTEFPKAATPEGREQLAKRIAGRLDKENGLDVRKAMREEANALWADEIRAASAARENKIRDARDRGHSDVQDRAPTPRKPNDMDVVRQAVRDHILNG